jgi:hypothetical protein
MAGGEHDGLSSDKGHCAQSAGYTFSCPDPFFFVFFASCLLCLEPSGGMFTNARDNYQVISLVVEAEAHKFVLSILFVSPHR